MIRQTGRFTYFVTLRNHSVFGLFLGLLSHQVLSPHSFVYCYVVGSKLSLIELDPQNLLLFLFDPVAQNCDLSNKMIRPKSTFFANWYSRTHEKL